MLVRRAVAGLVAEALQRLIDTPSLRAAARGRRAGAGAPHQRSGGAARRGARPGARADRAHLRRMTGTAAADVEQRARLSLGRSHQRIYQIVADVLAARGAGGVLADVGCGTGDLWQALRGRFRSCIGVDAVRYDGLPADVEFHAADLDARAAAARRERRRRRGRRSDRAPGESARLRPRAGARSSGPGGWVVVTTPNQLSALSLLTLVVKGRFSAFQDGSYPAHRTALLEIDLRRIMSECGLRELAVAYTRLGRLPLSRLALSRRGRRPRAAVAVRQHRDRGAAVTACAALTAALVEACASRS